MEYIERSMSMWFRPMPTKATIDHDRPVSTAKRKTKPTKHAGKTAKTTEFHHKAFLQCNNTVRPLPESSNKVNSCEKADPEKSDEEHSNKLHILDRVVGNLQTLLSEMRNYTVFEQHKDSNVEKIEHIDVAVSEKARKNSTLRFIKKKRNSAKQYFKHVSKMGGLRRTDKPDKDTVDDGKKTIRGRESSSNVSDLLLESNPLFEAKLTRRGRTDDKAPPVPKRTLSPSVNTLNVDRLSAMSVCRFPKSESLWRAVVLREHRKKCQNRLTELEEEARMLKYAIYSKCS